MKPYWESNGVTLHLGDCRDVLAGLAAASVDAIVTDPPAGIAFMGRDWDSNMGGRDQWIRWLADRMKQAYRVLKPGGHALVWALPRTSHWTATALEDAGFEIRDCIVHVFGSGWPKSLNVSKAIDKAAGAKREVIGASPFASRRPCGSWTGEVYGDEAAHGEGPIITASSTDDAKRWDGWGTALKPGQEHWWLVRKPLAGAVAANVLEYGTGALNIDGCRTPTTDDLNGGTYYGTPSGETSPGWRMRNGAGEFQQPSGRWPTNIVFTHSASCVEDGPCVSDCPVGELDRQSGASHSSAATAHPTAARPAQEAKGAEAARYHVKGRGDFGGASRFFPTFRYEAKAPASERPRLADGTAHPTVKPVNLVRFLARLISPPGGLVLDPFAGSGTTGEACVIEGFRCLLIEADAKHTELIVKRLSKPIQPSIFGEVAP